MYLGTRRFRCKSIGSLLSVWYQVSIVKLIQLFNYLKHCEASQYAFNCDILERVFKSNVLVKLKNPLTFPNLNQIFTVILKEKFLPHQFRLECRITFN